MTSAGEPELFSFGLAMVPPADGTVAGVSWPGQRVGDDRGMIVFTVGGLCAARRLVFSAGDRKKEKEKEKKRYRE